MKTRAEERKALVALLEQEYASPEAAAEAIFTAVADMLSERTAYGVRVGTEGIPAIAVGPFWDLNGAKKLVKALPEGWAQPAKLFSPATALRNAEPPADKRICQVCNHPKFAHVKGKVSGCLAGRITTKYGRVIDEGCGCEGDVGG